MDRHFVCRAVVTSACLYLFLVLHAEKNLFDVSISVLTETCRGVWLTKNDTF